MTITCKIHNFLKSVGERKNDLIISLVKNSVYEDHLCRTTEAMTEVSRSADSRGISEGQRGTGRMSPCEKELTARPDGPC